MSQMSPSLAARANAFLIASWCEPENDGVDQVADVRMARMHRQLVAVLDRARGSRRCRRSRARVDALRVQVERHVDEVDVAGALAVAEQAAFDAIGAGHHGELAGGGAGAAVVVRVHRQHDARRAARRWRCIHSIMSAKMFGVECSTVDGRLTMHLRSGVGCQTVGRRRRPTRLENVELGAREHLGRILEAPVGVRLLRGAVRLNRRAWRGREVDDAVLVHAEHHACASPAPSAL